MPRRAHHPAVRRRRNKEPSAGSLSAPQGPVGPELPGSYWRDGGRVRFLKVTRQWWESLRRDPRASVYSPVEWQTLLLVAHHHDQAWRGDSKAAAEFRQLAKDEGLTRSAANSMDWSIDPKIAGPTPDIDAEADEPSGDPRLRAV